MLRKQTKIKEYTIIKKIEESNYAIIYKVKTDQTRPLVLKIAKKKDIEYNELISREFQILSQFRHPNIVSVIDYDTSTDDRAYFTLEFIPGKPINQCFNSFSEDFISAIIQIINGLSVFHNKGFIHSDLKPEHILYNTNEKKAVLIDFGFAIALTHPTTLAGTLGYIAPEIIKGVGIDQRSDIYSLGVIIYEILSGKKYKGSHKPVKGLPGEVNNLLARLISREPAIRSTIPELYQTLVKYLRTIKVEKPTYEVRLPDTAFVEIPEIVDKLLHTSGQAIIINGDTGAGKTRLLLEIKYKYLMQNHFVLLYNAREKTGFLDCLKSFVNCKNLTFSEKEDKYQLFEEINEKLITSAKNKNIVIMVDEIDNLSDYELALFRYIGYGIKGADILLIGASKLNKKIEKLGFEIISLRPFSVSETQHLVEKTFFILKPATITETSHPDRFSRWLHKQSGGNPLFVVEILKKLYKNKILCYGNNKWYIEIKKLDKVAIPSKIEDLLDARIKDLNIDEMKILKILSLTDHPLESIVITSVLNTRIDICIEHLRTLGLLKENIINNSRVIHLPNQILTQSIEKLLTKKEKNSFYKKLIKAIEEFAPKDKDYAPILAKLCDKTGDNNKAYKYLISSAKNSESIYDYDSAIVSYMKMLKYIKDIDLAKYPEILIKIADLNQRIANNPVAMKYYKKALKHKTKDYYSMIYSGLGRVYSAMGQHTKAIRFLKKALIVTKNMQDHIKTANRLAYSLILSNQFKEAKEILNQSFLLSEKINEVELTAEIFYYQTSFEWFKGNFNRGIEKAKENLKYTQKNKLLKQFAYTANLLGMLYQKKGDINQTQKYLEEAIDVFKEMKLINALTNALSNQVRSYLLQGNLLQAKELFENALIRTQQIGDQANQSTILINLGTITGELGNFDEAIKFNKKALKIKPDEVIPNYNLAMLFYKKGEIDKAKSIFEKAIKKEKFPLYYMGLALINLILGKKEYAEELITKALDAKIINSLDISVRIDLFLKTARFYYDVCNFEKALIYAKKVKEIASQSSRENIIASALIKINNFKLHKISSININNETSALKNMGCIYDYVYLKKLVIDSVVDAGIEQHNIKNVLTELNTISEVFNAIGANLELNRVKKIKEKLFPIIARDYLRRTISDKYLETFSKLAELISSNLGNDDFLQNILDLIIQTTNAERGALFTSTSRGMKFAAGRNIDRTTIKDAGEFSKTAIKELSENRIVYAQDAMSDPNFNTKKSVMLNKIRSILCIPLSVSENVVGALYLDSRLEHSLFSPKDKDILLAVSRILASVIEKSIAFKMVSEENILLKSKLIEEIGSGYLIGKSKSMKKVYKLIESVAQVNSPVLILGETGTGKGMLARLIHLKSTRKNKKFQTINCSTIPETLLESELFGHKKGAFTGAINDKKGLLEEAQGGTIFLDEITNTSPSFQAKLLEAIEDKVIRHVGDTQTRQIEVRFLFATNKDIEIEVEENRFRKDLYYRINVFSIEVPPLRERLLDIPVLAEFFSNRYSKEINKNITGFTPEALKRLKEYYWPGNVRELQNVIERAVVLAKGQLITTEDLGFRRPRQAEIISLVQIKKDTIIEALVMTDWHVQKAAKLLGINRRTIQRYIRKYNIKK